MLLETTPVGSEGIRPNASDISELQRLGKLLVFVFSEITLRVNSLTAAVRLQRFLHVSPAGGIGSVKPPKITVCSRAPMRKEKAPDGIGSLFSDGGTLVHVCSYSVTFKTDFMALPTLGPGSKIYHWTNIGMTTRT